MHLASFSVNWQTFIIGTTLHNVFGRHCMALELRLALIKGFDSQAVFGKSVLLRACTRSADLMRALQGRMLVNEAQ